MGCDVFPDDTQKGDGVTETCEHMIKVIFDEMARRKSGEPPEVSVACEHS
jgi:hypothetical protein